jgi:protoporphyrinogen oxidase
MSLPTPTRSPVGSGRHAIRLVEELGLQTQTLAAGSAARNRYILHNGGLQRLPTSFAQLFMSPLTQPVLLGALRDLGMHKPATGVRQMADGGRNKARGGRIC